jgi:hypothetical protein
MHYALCIMHYALCIMHYAACMMLCAMPRLLLLDCAALYCAVPCTSVTRWIYEAVCLNEFSFSGEKGDRTAQEWLSGASSGLRAQAQAGDGVEWTVNAPAVQWAPVEWTGGEADYGQTLIFPRGQDSGLPWPRSRLWRSNNRKQRLTHPLSARLGSARLGAAPYVASDYGFDGGDKWVCVLYALVAFLAIAAANYFGLRSAASQLVGAASPQLHRAARCCAAIVVCAVFSCLRGFLERW